MKANLYHLYLKAELTDTGIAAAKASGIFVHGGRTVCLPLWEFGQVFGYPALKVRRVFVDDVVEIVQIAEIAERAEFDPSSIKNETPN